jgi:hypothetical protein
MTFFEDLNEVDIGPSFPITGVIPNPFRFFTKIRVIGSVGGEDNVRRTGIDVIMILPFFDPSNISDAHLHLSISEQFAIVHPIDGPEAHRSLLLGAFGKFEKGFDRTTASVPTKALGGVRIEEAHLHIRPFVLHQKDHPIAPDPEMPIAEVLDLGLAWSRTFPTPQVHEDEIVTGALILVEGVRHRS